MITVMSVVIASIVSIPTKMVLTMLFGYIGAPSTKQVQTQLQAAQVSTVLSAASESAAIVEIGLRSRGASINAAPTSVVPIGATSDVSIAAYKTLVLPDSLYFARGLR